MSKVKEEIVYIELDNWFPGRDYPDVEPINTWVETNQFSNDDWCRENRLCVVAGPIDMSMCWLIAAPRAWVEKNCPDILSDEILEYGLIIGGKRNSYKYKASDFICKLDETGYVEGKKFSRFGFNFPEYKEGNFGVTWNYSYWGEDEEDI